MVQKRERTVLGRPIGTTEWIWLQEERDYDSGKLLGYTTNGENIGSYYKKIRFHIDQVELRKFPDWDEFRREVAKNALYAIAQGKDFSKDFSPEDVITDANMAVAYADALIEALTPKKKE